ncbi:nucleoside phosphorylase domain-containing protein [Aspergillus cavernicola]|uniref:Nucleoside phosphorylase domain-containing protein n=1 Tax=Aspergillus cavernicola TaxID=176166 RepID=A0ABR4IDY1_9EURO
MGQSVAPSRRDEFEIAIFCALALEYNAVTPLFDQYWERDYGRVMGDNNTYTTGRIGTHNVVLVLLAGMGKVHASIASANINPSYTRIRLALLVGICGGTQTDTQGNEIFLGDVVISDQVVQYDFARQFPDAVVPKGEVRDILGRETPNIRGFVNTLQTSLYQQHLRARTLEHLKALQEDAGSVNYSYPGRARDKLFRPDYRHKHRSWQGCLVCDRCVKKSHPTCEQAKKLSCDALDCDEANLIPRTPGQSQRREKSKAWDGTELQDDDPWVHFGPIASGDLVMKSGEDRDRIAQAQGIIAFEMEGAGVYDNVPTIIIKGVCDYADCHKNKSFQNYAAATAAATMKAVLQRYQQTDRSFQAPHAIPHKARGGVGRGGRADYGYAYGGRATGAQVTRASAIGGTGFGGHARGRDSATGGEAEGGEASGPNPQGGDAIQGDAELFD